VQIQKATSKEKAFDLLMRWDPMVKDGIQCVDDFAVSNLGKRLPF
jgi:hypothetical protein